MDRKKEVEKLAEKLEAWAQTKELTDNERILLRLLVSREYRKIDTEIKIDRGTYVFKKDIKQAVMDALEHIDDSGNPVSPVPSDPRENWPRGGPVWQRADSWARAYWPRSS